MRAGIDLLVGAFLVLICSEWALAQDIFDFIIVGGGTSACVLANRLSANGTFSVLLLEIGDFPTDDMDVPALASTFQQQNNVTFQFDSVPQRRVMSSMNGVGKIVTGRGLGGSSSINNMLWTRGSPLAYDSWADLTGDESWKYSNLLYYFKKSETYLGEFPSDQHGFHGQIPVSYEKYAPGRELWLASGRELGYKLWDPNGPQKISFTPIELSAQNGRRVSSYSSYIKPIKDRQNLKIITRAYVTQVLFDGGAATGVKYRMTNVSGSEDYEVSAFSKKEVILSAGSYGSAILLLKSGIGPQEVLKQAGIEVFKDLPVGEGLADYPVLPLQFVINSQEIVFDPKRDLTRENYQLFSKKGEGPYTSCQGLSGQAFIASSVAKQDGHPDWADLELALESRAEPLTPFQNATLAPWETPLRVLLYLTRSTTRGNVKLDPENLNNPPLVDFDMLGNPSDEQVFLDGINVALDIFLKTETYRKVGARYLPDILPECRGFKFRSEVYWRCYIREMLNVGNHPSGTCAMNSVVDSSLRVLGVKRLRVVDASVIPLKASVNLQASVYAIAEKAADGLLLDWK